MKILFQGSPGAYSHLAALEVYPDAEIIPCKTFDECFDKAKENDQLKIIIPESNRITGSIAACHAGWQGIVKGIIINSLEKFNLSEKNKEELIIVLGPAISKEHYQVDINLAKKVFNSIHNLNKESESKDQVSISNTVPP